MKRAAPFFLALAALVAFVAASAGSSETAAPDPSTPRLADLALHGPAALAVTRGVPEVGAAPAAKPADAKATAEAPAAPTLDKPTDLLARFPALVAEGRKDKMDAYPCSECHDESLAPNPTERVLTENHDDIVLKHGGGRFWCTTCHGASADKDSLVSLKGQPIDFDQSYLLCGQCHFQQQRDFFYGAHGKRLGSWRGERKVAACTSCHDAHDPSIKPRKPWRGPDATR